MSQIWYDEFMKVGPTEFLKSLQTRTIFEHTDICATFLQNEHLEKWYIPLHCLLFLQLRGAHRDWVDWITRSVRTLYKLACPYVEFSLNFKESLTNVVGYLAKAGVGYERSLSIPFAKLCHLVNYLHRLSFEQIDYLLQSDCDVGQTFEFLKYNFKLSKLENSRISRTGKLYEIVLGFSAGQYRMFNSVHDKFKREINLDSVRENFVVECVKNWSVGTRRPSRESLKQLFTQVKPDTILEAFAEVYPDITIIAQYPYIH